jgi:tartrate-resistant acid phosphatase type 5
MAGFCDHAIAMSMSLRCMVFFCVCFLSISAELQRFEHPIKPDGSLSFLVIGDWGRRGYFNQSKVADQVSFFFPEL